MASCHLHISNKQQIVLRSKKVCGNVTADHQEQLYVISANIERENFRSLEFAVEIR
jgi:hypothetical protein